MLNEFVFEYIFDMKGSENVYPIHISNAYTIYKISFLSRQNFRASKVNL